MKNFIIEMCISRILYKFSYDLILWSPFSGFRITQGKTSNSKSKTIDADLIFLGATTALSGEFRRETDWDSAVTCHRDSDIVCTWSVFKSTIGSYRLKPQPGQGKDQINFTATCVHVSYCG